jgi:LysR family transcriptional regulator AphB
MLDDLSLFVSVVDHGSFTRAAVARAIPAATLSRRIKALEETLGVQLLHRNAHGLTATDSGQRYYDRCCPLLTELTQITDRLDDELHAMRGPIRVLAPVNMANTWLRAAWLRMMERFPEVHLDLHLSNRNQDLMGQPFDLAVRAGPQSDSSFVCRRIAQIRTVTVATPRYLARHGTPRHPNDLMAHRLLVAAPITRWTFRPLDDRGQPQEGPVVELEVSGAFAADEWGLVAAACLADQGILLVPLAQVFEPLQSGTLVPALPGWRSQDREAYLIWPNRAFVPARVRALIETIVEGVGDEVTRTQPPLRAPF